MANTSYWRLRFGLRALFAFITLLCLLLGLAVALVIIPGERQRAAVTRIVGLGGAIGYHETVSWLLRHLHGVLPRDYVESVRYVKMNNLSIHDRDLECLSALPYVEWIDLDCTDITDVGLVHLQNCANITRLVVSNTQVTGTGFVNISKCKHLRILSVYGTPFDDKGAALLSHFPRLESLNVMGTKIGDDAIVHLESLKHLESLFIQDTNITEAGYSQLRDKLLKCDIQYW